MNISPDKLLQILETLARVDERTAAMEKRMDKYEHSFDTRITEIEDRVDIIEGWKGKLIGMASAAALIISVFWSVAGDDIKSAFSGDQHQVMLKADASTSSNKVTYTTNR